MADSAFTHVAPYYDALMSNIPYDMWADYVEEVFEHLRVTPRRILDIATGTGSVAVLLAERGYKVAGVDLSAPMLEQARRKARDSGLDIDFIHRDAAELDLPADSFDAAVCLYDSFNYIVEPARLLRAFEGAAAALVAGGVFVFDLNTVYSFEQELFTQQNLSPERDVRYRWRSRYDRTTRIATVDMEFWTADGAHFRETHYERGYTEAEIIGMLDTAGFILEGIFEAYTFLPPGARSERVFYVARAGEAG
jgi:SAM-dependent methyltransferase